MIFVGGIVSASLGLLLAAPVSLSLDFALLLFSANAVSMVFATGLFSFLTAGILFGSRVSRLYLLSKIDEVGIRRAFLIRVLHVLVVTSFFTSLFAITVFVYPVVLQALVYHPISFSHFVFLPAVLGASLVGSVFLALIASSLATFTDDSRLCVVLGCASTLLIAFLAGWFAEPSPSYYSLTRNLAFLSPHNIVRALAILLSGYQFESANRMVEYVGFTFSAMSLALALLVLGSISLVLLVAGQMTLTRNSVRWKVLKGMIPSHEIWSAPVSTAQSQETARVRRRLRIQRGLTIVVIGTLLVSMSAGVSMHTTFLSNSTTFIHYVSSGDEERIPVESWNVFDVDVQPPYPGLFNSLFMYCDVKSWGNASDSLSFYFDILAMNSTEFNSLDEESRFALLDSNLLNVTWNGEWGEWGFGFGRNLEESYGSYICVLFIIADANPLEISYIEASLLIVQQGI